MSEDTKIKFDNRIYDLIDDLKDDIDGIRFDTFGVISTNPDDAQYIELLLNMLTTNIGKCKKISSYLCTQAFTNNED